jgi:uncharacterized protein (UPF0254 family)
MRIVGSSSNGGSQVFSTQIPIEVKVEVVKPCFEVDTKTRMVDIINMKVSLMEMDEETLEEEELKEVVEVMVEVIKVNNQITIQIATTAGNLGTWRRNCYEREHDARNGKLQQGNYESTSIQGDEQLFVMQHMANSMIRGVSDNNV